MRTAIATDSNSGITQEQAEKLGIYVLPMPFMINGEMFYEGVNLTHEEFFRQMEEGADITTSQPSPGEVTDFWDKLLKEYDEILYIPMSSGLSGSWQGTGCKQPAYFRYSGAVCIRCQRPGCKGL